MLAGVLESPRKLSEGGEQFVKVGLENSEDIERKPGSTVHLQVIRLKDKVRSTSTDK
jgi:hypothetical protein